MYFSPTLSEVLEESRNQVHEDMVVATPGVVVSYNAATRTASVKPGVHRLTPDAEDLDDDIVEEYPVVQNVPVCWLIGRGIEVKATLQPGDPVLLLALDRDPSGWRRTGQASEPDDARLHDLAFSVAIPGLVPDSHPFVNTDAAALASKVDLLINTMLNWVPVAQDGGAALSTAVQSAFAGFITSGSSILKLGS